MNVIAISQNQCSDVVLDLLELKFKTPMNFLSDLKPLSHCHDLYYDCLRTTKR